MSWFVKSRNAGDQPVNTIHCDTPQKVCEMYEDQQNRVEAKSGLKMRMIE
jgi:hypothetical protein